MAKKNVKENESVVVDVDTDVTSVSNVSTNSDANGVESVELPVVPKRKAQSKSKKVADVALETQIADMEKALENAKSAIESAAADNERMADELGVAVAENKSLRKELSKCKQDYKKAQGDNRANSALVETINDELTRVKVRNKELMETISRLQDKIKQYADELSEKDKAASAYDFDIATRDAEISKLEQKLCDIEYELKKYKTMTLWQRIKFVFLKEKVFELKV